VYASSAVDRPIAIATDWRNGSVVVDESGFGVAVIPHRGCAVGNGIDGPAGY
jgi:hypothetical protein